MATGTAALANKVLGKSTQNKNSKSSKKSSSAKKSSAKKSSKPIEVRTKMSDGSKRKTYKSGSGMVAEIEKMAKAGKTLEAIARHFGKENKDISWYVNYLRKNGRLSKTLPKREESPSK